VFCSLRAEMTKEVFETKESYEIPIRSIRLY
jgi:hypothetical protein